MKPKTLSASTTCREAYDKLKNETAGFILIVNDNDKVMGYITLQSIRAGLMNSSAKWSDSIEKIINKQFYKIPNTSSLGRISVTLDKELFVVIVDDKNYGDEFLGIVTQENLFDIINQ